MNCTIIKGKILKLKLIFFLYRFMAIWWPLKKQITKKRAKAMIIGIWLFALFLTSPWLIYFELTPMSPSRPDIEMCFEIWPQHEWFNETSFFIVANLCMRFLIPTVLIFVCYTLIWIKVTKRVLKIFLWFIFFFEFNFAVLVAKITKQTSNKFTFFLPFRFHTEKFPERRQQKTLKRIAFSSNPKWKLLKCWHQWSSCL